MSAACRYKDIIGGMSEAAAALRRADTERAAALAERLVELDEAMRRAAERSALTALGVGLQWEAALESLWGEHWMTLRPLPAPSPTPHATPRDLDYLDTVVAQRYEALREAVRRRPLLGRR
ncbi:MAG: hypothetical protein JO100_07940 [Pseudonocardia sp.]|nr:hypothetical protein [Pseudonocardia sp.]